MICLLIPVYGFCQDNAALHYKIYSTREKKVVPLTAIATQMADADVLFFGEEHNDSTGHALEFELLQLLETKYPAKVALSMEMFETDCQNVVNEYLLGLIREKNFLTDARAWPNYKDYRPMVEFAKSNNLPVIAANAPARYVNRVNRMGLNSLDQLSQEAKTYLPPLPVDTAAGVYYDKFAKIMGGHASMAGMQLYQAQNLWDATMAWSLARFYRGHQKFKILQLNGGFHSEEKLGTAAQLKKILPDIRIVNIAAYADELFDNPDWLKYSGFADYIILTDPKLPKTF